MKLFDLFSDTVFQLCLFFVHNSANGQISILWKRISFAWKPNEKKIVVQFIMDGIKELVSYFFCYHKSRESLKDDPLCP